jgi:hypothetical protein
MCYMADGANSQQQELLGQLLFRRDKNTGKLDSRVIAISSISDKTAAGQQVAYKEAMAALADSAWDAGLTSRRAGEQRAEGPGGEDGDGAGSSSDPPTAAAGSSSDHAADAAAFFEERRRLDAYLRNIKPASSMNDRAPNGRAAARLVCGAEKGDDGATCMEHGLVNVCEAGMKACDAHLRGKMNITDEMAASDANDIKGIARCVGWNNSPTGALGYAVAKYVALFSSKGYAIGENFAQWLEVQMKNDGPALEGDLRGFVSDLQAICGSRNYVFLLNAAVVERFAELNQLHGFLKEEEQMAHVAGGKLRGAILAGFNSTAIMAAVRTMAFMCDAYMWPSLIAAKAGPEKHILDVGPAMWSESLRWLREAAADPAAVIDGSMRLDALFDAAGQRTVPRDSEGTATRGARAAVDMDRIRQTVEGDQAQHKLVCEMLTVGFTAMAAAVEVHASEFIGDGVFSAAKDTPELRAKLNGVPPTSTPCESLFASVKSRTLQQGVARHDTRVGGVVAKRDRTVAWAWGLEPEMRTAFLKSSRKRARMERLVTMKQQRLLHGEAKEPQRALKLAKKKSGRDKKAAELARLTAVVRATKFSELKEMSNSDLADQLKLIKLVLGRDIKKTTLPNRKAYVIRIQALLFNELGAGANDLEDGDDGYGGTGVRKRKAVAQRGMGKKLKLNGYEWYEKEEFEIDMLIDVMIADGGTVPGRTDVATGTELYLVLWKNFPVEIATWEVSFRLRAAARASGHAC